MRYRIGTDPEQARQEVDGMIVGTAVFGLFTGVIFVLAGMRARQFWLAFWGAGLVLASSAYLLYTLIR
ncbi:hypothetical protein [Thiohalophilus sp.]|uniref:hypothetical protein n=1 Tax=Thiohalophilus sp. TaxID=3028392 RepID=UPI002ACE1C91|nr:hypothetical protein [Thiohalophilus sp.]MDZ7803993.1 hypothetical protein [Thiohalophilus sp.]